LIQVQGDSFTPQRQINGDDQEQNEQNSSTPPEQQPPNSNPNAPIFRSDPTLKSCFDTVNLPDKVELKRLFMA